MRADDQLVAAVPDRLHQEIRQDDLVFRAQAVFRLVQQAERIHFDFSLEIHQRAFAVRALPQAFAGFVFDKPAHRFAAGRIDRVQVFKIFQGSNLEFFSFQFKVIFRQVLSPAVDALVDGTDIQHHVEHVVAGDDPACRGNLFLYGRPAAVHVILKEARTVVRAAPLQAELFGDDVQHRAFPAAIAAVEDGDRAEKDFGQASLRQDPVWINRLVISGLQVEQEIGFRFFVRKVKRAQKQEPHLLSPSAL